MNRRGTKLEPKLGLNMPFSELLERLVQTKPKEVDASIVRAKQMRPPAAAPPRKRLKRQKR
jgi:hypothetical protein